VKVLDRLKKKEVLSENAFDEPIWLSDSSETTRDLFRAASSEYTRIRDDILTNGNNRGSKKISLSKVAKIANKDRTNLHPRRQEKLCDWINRKNSELAQLKVNAPATKKKRQTSTELEKEVSALKMRLNDSLDFNYRKVVEEIFASTLLDDRERLSQENASLKIERRELEETLARVQHNYFLANQTISDIFDLLTPAQRANFRGFKKV